MKNNMKHFTVLNLTDFDEAPMIGTITNITNNPIGIKILEDNLMESLKEHFDTDDVKMGILPDLFAGSYGEDIVIVVDGMNYTIRIMETWIF